MKGAPAFIDGHAATPYRAQRDENQDRNEQIGIERKRMRRRGAHATTLVLDVGDSAARRAGMVLPPRVELRAQHDRGIAAVVADVSFESQADARDGHDRRLRRMTEGRAATVAAAIEGCRLEGVHEAFGQIAEVGDEAGLHVVERGLAREDVALDAVDERSEPARAMVRDEAGGLAGEGGDASVRIDDGILPIAEAGIEGRIDHRGERLFGERALGEALSGEDVAILEEDGLRDERAAPGDLTGDALHDIERNARRHGHAELAVRGVEREHRVRHARAS